MKCWLVSNKAKGWISKPLYHENKARQILCVSGGKKCSFFWKFDVPCFLKTPVLRFTLLPYYWRVNTLLYDFTSGTVRLSANFVWFSGFWFTTTNFLLEFLLSSLFFLLITLSVLNFPLSKWSHWWYYSSQYCCYSIL